MVHEALSLYEARYGILPVSVAVAIVEANTPLLALETVPLTRADGRVLGETVHSREKMPPFPASTVDGYAVLANDTTDWRTILADVLAGRPVDQSVRTGEAARIMTGAQLPLGADAVVMFEDTKEASNTVQLQRSVGVGDNLRPPGIDLEIGQTVLERGTLLGPAEIGLLATVGLMEVTVFRVPRVGVLSTGDELVEPDETPHTGAIRDSNRYALLSAAREAGAEVISFGMVKDDEDAQRNQIQAALDGCDVLLTSGGVSVGSRDLIKPILEGLGTVHFGRIALKPGKPLTFATIGGKLAFGLPGNPVSALVTFEVFVRPALRRMQGHNLATRPMVDVEIERDLTKTRDRTEYQRASVRWSDGRFIASSTGSQSSSRLLSMVGANALLVIEPGDGKVLAGTTVKALLVGAPL